MHLFESFMTSCVKLARSSVPDGEGGWSEGWQPTGEPFLAAIVLDASGQSLQADKAEGTADYTVTTRTKLSFHDVIRREKDGICFRVTSDWPDRETPKRATFDFTQVKAERWEPNDY